MAKSTLELYKDIVAEYKITEEENASPIMRVNYLREQIDQQKSILNRLLFDIATVETQKNASTDPVAKDAYRKKADDYRGDIVQILTGLRTNQRLIVQLVDEYPELQPEE